MTITLNIDIPESEKQLAEFVREHKDIAVEALKDAMGSFRKDEKIVYKKRDPRKYSHIIKREYNSEDADDVALLHIDDSAKFIHDLRRQRNI